MIYNIYINQKTSIKKSTNLRNALAVIPHGKKIFPIPYRTSDEILVVDPLANLSCNHLAEGGSKTMGRGLVYREELITEEMYCLINKDYLNTNVVEYSERVLSAPTIYENDDYKIVRPHFLRKK